MINGLVCISHLRWNFVYQRPQHLMSRAARDYRVYYVEEPLATDGAPHLERREENGVVVIVPHVPHDITGDAADDITREYLTRLLAREGVLNPTVWMYTPMRLPLLEALQPRSVIYDCMDELANFRFAPPELRERERRLFDLADIVFTGGYRLWESKRLQHGNAHPFPSSVDVQHFARARGHLTEPHDQQPIAGPRLGFAGVIDERFDVDLVREVATRRPEWQFVLLGPVVKIEPDILPQGDNLHYLGMKRYEELPAYMAHWDVALLPFARNEATEFISPTKTPEYLAAGRAVVSTDIRDVIRPYGEQQIARIARNADEFETAVHAALTEDNTERLRRADALLSQMSWDRTWDGMRSHIERIRSATAPSNKVASDRAPIDKAPIGKLVRNAPRTPVAPADVSPGGTASKAGVTSPGVTARGDATHDGRAAGAADD